MTIHSYSPDVVATRFLFLLDVAAPAARVLFPLALASICV